jgi:nucleoside-diphosphate-sugar epimerase
MAIEVVGRGMLARAFETQAPETPSAIICASGVADSRSADPSAFRRELELLRLLVHRAVTEDSLLVYFSGAPVYGPSIGRHTELDRPAPTSPYGRHKLKCEQWIVASGARYLVLRLPNVVGPVGNPSQLVPSLVDQAIAGRMVVMSGATRDLIDVDDVVGIVRGLIRRGTADAILNVASGTSTPVTRLAAHITAILGVAPVVDVVEGGDRQSFSTDLVRSLLPDYPKFDQGYPTVVLDRHVRSIYDALRSTEPARRRVGEPS